MPQPTVSDVHIDAALTNISLAYLQDPAAYVAGNVFPMVPVDKKSDKYFTYPIEAFFRDDSKPRAPGTESAGGGYVLSNDSYLCEEYAFHKDVDYQVRANADPAIDPEIDASRYVTQVLMIGRERNFVTNYFTTGVWQTDKVGATDFTRWDDDGGSDPITDISNGRTTVLTATGFKPNTLVVGFAVNEALKKHPLVVDRYKHVSADVITEDMVAKVLGVQTYLVSEAVYNSAAEGQVATMAFIAGKNALLCYVNPTPGLMVPSAGYIFAWSGLTGLNNMGLTMANIPVPLKKADRIEGTLAYGMKVVSKVLGYFFSLAVS